MARSRNIKPGFFLNEDLAETSFETRLLFAGLWTLADREGRLEDRPKKIKAAIFPYDQVNVDSMLDQLRIKGFISRYVIQGSRYIQINNWLRHQTPHYKEIDSIIPAQPIMSQRQPDVEPTLSQPCPLNPDSLILNPDSSSSLEEVEIEPTGGRAETIRAWQSYRLEILGKGIGESPHEYDWVEDTVRWMRAITADDPITNPYDMITDAINEARLRKTPPDNPVAWVKKVIADWLDELRKEAARGVQAEADVTG